MTLAEELIQARETWYDDWDRHNITVEDAIAAINEALERAAQVAGEYRPSRTIYRPPTLAPKANRVIAKRIRALKGGD